MEAHNKGASKMKQPNQSIYQSVDKYQHMIIDEIKKNQLLRINEVSKLTSLGKSTINLWVAQGKFPIPIHLSTTVKVWRLADIILWIESNAKGENHE